MAEYRLPTTCTGFPQAAGTLLAGKNIAAPLAKQSAETPLAHPPMGATWCRVPMVGRHRSEEKKLTMAATSALTFTTFSKEKVELMPKSSSI
jgi:hypothetical protein